VLKRENKADLPATLVWREREKKGAIEYRQNEGQKPPKQKQMENKTDNNEELQTPMLARTEGFRVVIRDEPIVDSAMRRGILWRRHSLQDG
jgi:hypothetical protein